MELLFNLIWMCISIAALLAWIVWRRSSESRAVPQMLRGLLVVVCILALLFPVISISDDLCQIPSLAEGNRIQDILKAPESRSFHVLAAVLPELLLALQPDSGTLTLRYASEVPITLRKICWSPSIEKRPPPELA